MRKLFAFLALSISVLFLASCQKPTPEAEIKAELEEAFNLKKNKFSLKKLKAEKVKGSEDKFSWKANISLDGTYWKSGRSKEFIEEYKLQDIVEQQRKNRPAFGIPSNFPGVPRDIYRSFKPKESKLEIYGTASAVYAVDKWTVKMGFDDIERSSLEKLSSLRGLHETSSLPEGAIMLGSKSGQQAADEFRKKTEAEITRLSAEAKKKEEEKLAKEAAARELRVANLKVREELIAFMETNKPSSLPTNFPAAQFQFPSPLPSLPEKSGNLLKIPWTQNTNPTLERLKELRPMEK